MPKVRLLSMILGTALCALGLGYFVQNGQAPTHAARTASPIQQSILQPSDVLADDQAPDLVLEEIQLTAATRDTAPHLSRPARRDLSLAAVTAGEGALPDTPAGPSVPRLGCDIDLSARAADMATVDLTIGAPCLPNERVTIHHSGMMFTDTTDATGRLDLNIPALSETAVFIVQFANGSGNVVITKVPGLKAYDRVVLQWSGAGGFQLHALEFGASYSSKGHVWSGSKRGTGGFVTALGNPDALSPHLAEVYTFPSGQSKKAGTIALSVEAEVTDANCGRDISAQVLELRHDGTLRPRDLTLAVPDCTAKGDFLVLNNLVEDLKVTAR